MRKPTAQMQRHVAVMRLPPNIEAIQLEEFHSGEHADDHRGRHEIAAGLQDQPRTVNRW